MPLIHFLQEVLTSIVIGTLIGIEREHHFKGTTEYAGLRTFALVSLFGTLCAMLSDTYGSPFIFAGLSAVIIYSAISYYLSFKMRKTIGITTQIVFTMAYLLGVMIHTFGPEFPISLAIIITLILTMKRYTARISEELQDIELLDTLKFAIVAFIILPLLPNQYVDPFSIINPYQLWLLVILISGISFFGYFLMKLFGAGRGILLTSTLGGIASSTAVTVALSDEVKNNEKLADAATVGVVIASTLMFFRVLLLVFIMNINVVPYLLPPFLVMGAVGLTLSWFMMNGLSRFEHQLKLHSPFSLLPALKFAIFFAFILVLSYFGNEHFGDAGIYVASFLSGLVDVDAIVLSLSQLLTEGLSYKVAATAIVIATLTNNMVKAAISFLFGSKRFGINVLKALVPMSLVGLAVVLLF